MQRKCQRRSTEKNPECATAEEEEELLMFIEGGRSESGRAELAERWDDKNSARRDCRGEGSVYPSQNPVSPIPTSDAHVLIGSLKTMPLE